MATTPQVEQTRRSPLFTMVVWLALALVIVAFAVLALAARVTPYFPLDLSVAQAVQSIPSPWFHSFMVAVSWPGFPPQAPVFAAVVILGCFLAHRRREALYIAASGIGIAALNQVVKMLVDRPRPPTNLIHVLDPTLNGGGWSFPAGHVVSYVAVLGFIFYLAYSSKGVPIVRVLTMVFTGAMVVLVGVSRIDSGEHWLSDVVAGYILGSLWLAGLILVYRRGQVHRRGQLDRRGRPRANTGTLAAHQDAAPMRVPAGRTETPAPTSSLGAARSTNMPGRR
jgi:membrane-associated phospholipid phosphatase